MDEDDDVDRDAPDCGLGCHWRYCLLATGMKERDEKHPASAGRKGSVLDRKNGNPWEVGSVGA